VRKKVKPIEISETSTSAQNQGTDQEASKRPLKIFHFREGHQPNSSMKPKHY